jgi:hypothetical protein
MIPPARIVADARINKSNTNSLQLPYGEAVIAPNPAAAGVRPVDL